jgi:hypothetical protein
MANEAEFAQFLSAFAVMLTREDARKAFLDTNDVGNEVFEKYKFDPVFINAAKLQVLRDNRAAIDGMQAIWKKFSGYENPPCPSPDLAERLQAWADDMLE